MRLVHFPINKLKPVGGPAGYLWNLKQGLDQIKASGYAFLPEASIEMTSSKILQKIVPTRAKEIRRLRNLLSLPDQMMDAPVDYSRYEAIHFHSTKDLYLHRRDIDGYDGKVILTSHSPLVYHKELIARLNPKDVRAHAEELGAVAAIDEYSFQRADYVIFPCPEAEEPYFHTWVDYPALREEGKMRYVPTGIVPASIKVGRDEIRDRYGIPHNAFVVSYVGRHNLVKGYDVLKSIAPELLANENVWFLIAGKEGPILGLNHPRWVEVGWTNDPHSLVAAADVFVLPNRETFFDLVMLEVLSIGQIVIASRTGGNKFFERFSCPGIRLYDKAEDLADLVIEIQDASEHERDAWRLTAKTLYEEEFTVETFATRFDATLDEIML